MIIGGENGKRISVGIFEMSHATKKRLHLNPGLKEKPRMLTQEKCSECGKDLNLIDKEKRMFQHKTISDDRYCSAKIRNRQVYGE